MIFLKINQDYPKKKKMKLHNKNMQFISSKSALVLAIIVFFQAVIPPSAQALTGGPSQPEVRGFQPIGTSNMVDLFTGDFNYNIPLLDVDGYPINISYQSNPTMDQEASWVGLGWSLTPGAINRTVRGVPDEFKGDAVTKEFNIRKDQTVGVTIGADAEFFGIEGFSGQAGLFYNNRRGPGIEASADYSTSIARTMLKNNTPESTKKTNSTTQTSETTTTTTTFGSINLDLNLSLNSQTGFGIPGISASYGLSQQVDERMVTKTEVSNDIDRTKGCLPINERTTLTLHHNAKPKISSTGGKIVSYTDFASYSSFPISPMPMENSSFSFQGKLTGELFGLAPGTTLGGYVSTQKLATNRSTRPSYGYLHLESSKRSSSSIQDYKKEKIAPYQGNKPVLPVSFGTYDLFSVSGQGISGQFRAMRNDIGVFRDPGLYNYSVSIGAGGEFGAGGIFKGGGNFNEGISTTTVKKWVDDNSLIDNIDFTESDGVYESVFFKGTGQKIITDKGFYDNNKGAIPMRTKVFKGATNIKASSSYVFESDGDEFGEEAISSPLVKSPNSREKRNQLFSFLTAGEADVVGYNLPAVSDPADLRKDHHMSEVSVTQEDGSRYIYGIAAYNKLKRDVVFNRQGYPALASGPGRLENDAELVEYNPGVDNTIENEQGNDYYYDSEEIPGFAHSYLLTQILSPDYVDRTGNGISDDDLGSVVKFNYDRRYGDEENDHFKWRTPYKENMAQYADGYRSKSVDDKASYVYGEKEIWYLESIESRTMVAKFYTSDREDGLGSKGPNGGKDVSQKIQKLDKIELYSKSEYQDGSNSDAIPIKTVHLNYSSSEVPEYSLCKKVPNQVDETKGKLNLASIHFTYEDSNRGMLNAYKFNYSNINPNYNLQAYDRWGCYREKTNPAITNNPNYPSPLPNPSEFPYVLQEHQSPNDATDPSSFETITDSYVGAWNLSSVELPSGSTINIKYESDDYAYVQDHRAGQMMFVNALSKSIPTDEGVLPKQEYLFEDDNDRDPSLYLRIKLPLAIRNDISLDEAIVELKKRYFENVEKIYFQSAVNLTGDIPLNNFEPIKGYMDYDMNEIGFTDNVDRDQIYIKVIPIKIRSQYYHPITVAALQTLRLNFPEIIYPGVGTSEGLSNTGLIKAVVGFASQIGRVVSGYYKNSIKKEWGHEVNLEKTWIRLANPDFGKEGGGSRVKEISISDGWNQANDGESIYGQRYTYTKEIDFVNEEKLTISSGVASYEPMIGNEENLMRKPLRYDPRVFLAPNRSFYVEKPVGESLFPMATVGYSNVKVESFGYYDNIDGDTSNDEKNGVGYSLNEFHTAKDFPVKVKYTPINNDTRIRPLGKFLQVKVLQKDKLGVSQGFSIETNDMHGKPAFEAVYDKDGSPITSTKYEYRTEKDSDGNPINQLDNLVDVLSPEGEISKAYLGLEIDTWQEMQQDEVHSKSVGLKANADGFLLAVLPAVVPVVLPSFTSFENEFSSTTTTKLIKHFGLLDKVTVVQDGSSIHTVNKLYDSETGEVLLTETQNEFDDALFSFKYPAHWAYEGMQLGYQNTGAVLDVEILDGELIADNLTLNILTHGDELLVEFADNTGTYLSGRSYFTESLAEPGKNLIQTVSGDVLPDGDYRIKIIRSGHRNQASLPIASVTTLVDPVSEDAQGNAISIDLDMDETNEIIAASAMEYNDQWKMQCERETSASGENILLPFSMNLNPYQSGLKGNWRPKKSHVYHTDRNGSNLSSASSEVEISSDGTYEYYTPFWDINASQDWLPNSAGDANWVAANTIEMYDIRGNEIENIDAINNYSSAQFAYENTRVNAIASNAQKCEINYDGFEDYYFKNTSSIFGFPLFLNYTLVQNVDLSAISTDFAHTGNYSLKIDPLSFASETSRLKPYAAGDCESGCLATATSNSPVCAKNPIQLFASPGDTYIWTGPNGFTSTQQNPVISSSIPSNAGTYSVTVTGESGCVSSAEVAVEVVGVIAEASSNSPVCQTQQIELFGSGGMVYSWTGPNGFISNSQNPTLNTFSLNPGTYTFTLVVTSASGCTDTDQVSVIVNSAPTFSLGIDLPPNPPYLQGSTFVLEATTGSGNPPNYEWFDPSGASVQSGTSATLTINNATCANHGNYTVQVLDGSCLLEASVFVDIDGCGIGSLTGEESTQRRINQTASIEHLIPASCNHGGIVSFSQKEFKYKWSDGEKGAVRTNLVPGSYAVTITNGESYMEIIELKVDRECEMQELVKRSSTPISLCDQCLPTLHLDVDKEYFFNVWAATQKTVEHGGILENAKIEISFEDDAGILSSLTVEGTPWGPIVDGWQRMAGSFTVPVNAIKFTTTILNDSDIDALYVDDFRIHPINSNMVSYVYDDQSLRLMATLDDNNYASFYEYDEEGILVRTKRETEKGIVTIQEARTVLKPNN